jgi:hypothetical protein
LITRLYQFGLYRPTRDSRTTSVYVNTFIPDGKSSVAACAANGNRGYLHNYSYHPGSTDLIRYKLVPSDIHEVVEEP